MRGPLLEEARDTLHNETLPASVRREGTNDGNVEALFLNDNQVVINIFPSGNRPIYCGIPGRIPKTRWNQEERTIPFHTHSFSFGQLQFLLRRNAIIRSVISFCFKWYHKSISVPLLSLLTASSRIRR